MRIAGICEITEGYYFDDSKIWKDGIYPHRIKIKPLIIPKHPIHISFYFRYKGKAGGYFGQAIRILPEEEFSIFQTNCKKYE